MMQQLKQQEATEQETKVTEPLTLENVQTFYNKHLESVEQESTRNLLKSVNLSLTEQDLKATVSSKLVESALRQELDLVQGMRDHFGVEDLKMVIEIDKSKIKKAPKRAKPMTNKEKLRQMYEQNPNIKELTDRFGLRFDD